MNMYWDFAVERQRVWRKKISRQPRPWTEDKTIDQFSFTNVYRLLDPGTQFVVRNLLTHESKAIMVFNIMLYRTIGRESTYSDLIHWNDGLFDPKDPLLFSKLVDYLRYVRDILGVPPFSKAYTVTSFSWAPGETKVEKFAWQAAQWAKEWDKVFAASQTPEDMFITLSSLQGIGRFIASQTFVDCTYVNAATRDNAMGWEPSQYREWMKAGPGAIDGLSKLFGKSTDYCQKNDLQLLQDLHDIHNQELKSRGFDWATLGELYPSIYPNNSVECGLSIQDIQNWCCEFSKYHKLVNTPGKSRRRYTPRDSSQDEQTDDSFIVALQEVKKIELVVYAETSAGYNVGCKLGGRDVTDKVSQYSGYPTHRTPSREDSVQRGDVPYLDLLKPDPAKYDPKNSNTDPVTELAYHLGCGLPLEVPFEMTLVGN